jgi:hypothetical protein
MSQLWDEITATTLYNRSQRLANIVQKTNALFEQLQNTQQLRYDEDRKKRNLRRAHNRWRAREARRNSAASAVVPSTPALAAAERGLPKLGAPEDDLRNAIVAACETDSAGHFYLQRELRAAQQRSQADIERSSYLCSAELKSKIEMPEGIAWCGPFGGRRIESHALGPYAKIANTIDLLALIRESARKSG